jgi:hypothetical protein
VRFWGFTGSSTNSGTGTSLNLTCVPAALAPRGKLQPFYCIGESSGTMLHRSQLNVKHASALPILVLLTLAMREPFLVNICNCSHASTMHTIGKHM